MHSKIIIVTKIKNKNIFVQNTQLGCVLKLFKLLNKSIRKIVLDYSYDNLTVIHQNKIRTIFHAKNIWRAADSVWVNGVGEGDGELGWFWVITPSEM